MRSMDELRSYCLEKTMSLEASLLAAHGKVASGISDKRRDVVVKSIGTSSFVAMFAGGALLSRSNPAFGGLAMLLLGLIAVHKTRFESHNLEHNLEHYDDPELVSRVLPPAAYMAGGVVLVYGITKLVNGVVERDSASIYDGVRDTFIGGGVLGQCTERYLRDGYKFMRRLELTTPDPK
ncbi:MAG: hypothetical protein OXR66_02200 [Candidatus Woesearchaeota archaeon]|nr:hypothetical protein [Candidatus Woesearchaeota archaeon]